MSDTLTTGRRVLELAEVMRRTLKRYRTIVEYEDAAEEWSRIMASGWPEEAARAIVTRHEQVLAFASKGGKARAITTSRERATEIARHAARTRWAKALDKTPTPI